jgi:voltage-gated potassium channel
MIFALIQRVQHWFAAAGENPIRRFQIALLTLTALVIYGSIGYILIEGMSPLDALYMTVITITTIGFGEIQPLSAEGRIFTLSVIVLGVGAAATAISEAIRVALEPVLWQTLQRRRMERSLRKMENHYIVCGYGRVGRQVVQDFQLRQVPFIVVDANEDSEAIFLQRGIACVIGDATREDILQQARIDRARGLVSVLTNDADNIMTVLTARMLNRNLTIIARVVRAESEQKLRLVGANQVINPYKIGGHRISLSLLRPAVNQFLQRIFHFDETTDVDIGQISVSSTSAWAGKALGEIGLRERGLMAMAIVREGSEMQIAPPEAYILQHGDQVVMIGPSARVYEMEQTGG